MPPNTPKPLELLEQEQRRTAERRYLKMQLWMNVLGIGFVLLAMGVGYAVSPHHSRTTLLLFVIPVAILIVILAISHGVVGWLRHRGVWWAQPSPLLAIGFKQRRRLIKALRRDEPAPDDIHLAIVYACMRWLARMHAYLMILPCVLAGCLVLNSVTQTLRPHPSMFVMIYNSVLAVVVLWAGLRRNRLVTRNSRRRVARSEPA